MIVPGVRGTVVHLVRDVITVDPLRRESQGQSGVQILEKPRLKLSPSFSLSLSLSLSLFLSLFLSCATNSTVCDSRLFKTEKSSSRRGSLSPGISRARRVHAGTVRAMAAAVPASRCLFDLPRTDLHGSGLQYRCREPTSRLRIAFKAVAA